MRSAIRASMSVPLLPAIAEAHVLDGDVALTSQLLHQLLGWHHLPLALAALGVVVVAIAVRRRRAGR